MLEVLSLFHDAIEIVWLFDFGRPRDYRGRAIFNVRAHLASERIERDPPEAEAGPANRPDNRGDIALRSHDCSSLVIAVLVLPSLSRRRGLLCGSGRPDRRRN